LVAQNTKTTNKDMSTQQKLQQQNAGGQYQLLCMKTVGPHVKYCM